MATDAHQAASSYPIPVYNYRVTIDSETLGFSEVSGLGIQYETVTYRHGLSFAAGMKIIPGMRQPVKVTLKKGVFKDSRFLARWFKDAYSNPLKPAVKDVVVDLCDEEGTPVIRWKILGAVPVRLEAPTLDSGSNQTAIETLELAARDILIDDPV